jgi:hypothetical protein
MTVVMAVVVAMKLVAVKLVRGLGCEVGEEREWKKWKEANSHRN